MALCQALGNLKIAFAIDARTLAHDYDTNEVGADLKYKGKRILVTGVLDSINKTFLDKPYVVLVGYQFRTVNAGFGRKDADSLADLRKGQTASFVCEVSGMSLSDVYLKNCSTFGVYANTLRSIFGRKIADALNGKVQVSKEEAQRIARLYVMAAYFAKNLPQDSNCFRIQDSACINQMEAVNKTFQKTSKTDAWKKDSNAKIDTLISRMNVG